jgi:DNA-directed RNA polymerase specialized sigma24 family protein
MVDSDCLTNPDMSVTSSMEAARPRRFGALDIAPPAQPPSADRPRMAPSVESAAFEQYVLPHLDAAYNLALWLTRDATLAGNVVQDTALRAIGLSCLAQAVASLALDLRECLVLREMEGLTYGEIATITGVPIRTTMSRLWCARDALLQDSRWRTEDREASTA